MRLLMVVVTFVAAPGCAAGDTGHTVARPEPDPPLATENIELIDPSTTVSAVRSGPTPAAAPSMADSSPSSTSTTTTTDAPSDPGTESIGVSDEVTIVIIDPGDG